MRRLIFLLLCLPVLSGCGAISKITAFKDPAYSSKSFGTIVVFAQGMTFEAAVLVERQICERVAPTNCVSGKSILPPTRQYTPEEVQSHLSDTRADGALIVVLVDDKSETRYFGNFTHSTSYGRANTYGSINFYGNNAFWSGKSYASMGTQTISTPMYGHSRIAFGQLGLFELSSGNIAWIGEISVKGKGRLNVTDKAFIDSATIEIAKELKAAGLIK